MMRRLRNTRSTRQNIQNESKNSEKIKEEVIKYGESNENSVKSSWGVDYYFHATPVKIIQITWEPF